jgi:stress-induced morphogen
MAVPFHILEQRLKDAFPLALCRIQDTAGDQDQSAVTLVDRSFQGLSTLKRHQLVYQALSDLIEGPLHALSLKTLTPDEAPHD